MNQEATLEKVEELIGRYPALAVCREDLRAAVQAICESYAGGHKLFVCSNGGDASGRRAHRGRPEGFLLPRKLARRSDRRSSGPAPRRRRISWRTSRARRAPSRSRGVPDDLGTRRCRAWLGDRSCRAWVLSLGARPGQPAVGHPRLSALHRASSTARRPRHWASPLRLRAERAARMAAEHLAETVIRARDGDVQDPRVPSARLSHALHRGGE